MKKNIIIKIACIVVILVTMFQTLCFADVIDIDPYELTNPKKGLVNKIEPVIENKTHFAIFFIAIGIILVVGSAYLLIKSTSNNPSENNSIEEIKKEDNE